MMEGRLLGSYRIASLVGSGGMGEVYRAYDEKLRREVAIKVLRSSDGDDNAARALLLREARAAAALNHPNICTIHEVGEHDGQAFLAMELVDGEPLHRMIPPGAGLPIDRMLEYSVQVADALAHAHERGVLHRDLKAQNIVITRAGRAKVLDFGLAKRVVTSNEATTETVGAFTTPGAVAGTPAYMSPEQLQGCWPKRSDVRALGGSNRWRPAPDLCRPHAPRVERGDPEHAGAAALQRGRSCSLSSPVSGKSPAAFSKRRRSPRRARV
jgi:serine/threonine protein kinase